MTVLAVGEHWRTGAEFSLCRSYRYRLWREWGDTCHRCAFVMLNPSTADETVDDPTIRRCIDYAKRWGFGALDIGNAFALRSTDPKMLYQHEDPVGPGNDEALNRIAASARRIVMAWGVHGALRERGLDARRLLERALGTMAELGHMGLTTKGFPRHPLYLSKHAAFNVEVHT